MDKLIFADVDGTILRHNSETATQRVARTIGRLLAAGDLLVPVTSRTPKMMGELAAQVGLRHMGVLDGGATIYDFEKNAIDPSLSRRMPPEQTNRILAALDPFCDDIYFGEDSRLYGPDAQLDVISPSVFAVFPNTVKADVSNALAAIPSISTHFNRFEETTTHSCVQIVCDGVSKHSGVRALLGIQPYANIAPQNIVAMGDGEPDKRLMMAVPDEAQRIAVGDNPALRGVATTFVPPASHDGFSIAIERYVLHNA